MSFHFDFDGGVIMVLHEPAVFVSFSAKMNEIFVIVVKPCIPILSVFTTPFLSLSTEEPMDVKMAPLSRFEPEGAELLDIQPDISQLFDKIG